ncbi:MAG: single-stranded-DNA-specific exonuclease RecJ [Chloroflexota bacterium]
MQAARRPQWNILAPAPNEYLSTAPVPPLVGQLLYNRGIAPEDVHSFLQPSEPRGASPFRLPDMSRAVERIYSALLRKEHIGVYGDFDVDGVSATGLLVRVLRNLGTFPHVYIPERTAEGHGLNERGLRQMKEQGVSLVITVDCGVSDLPAAHKAREMGLDLIITDHHIPPATLPPAHAVVDAKRPESQYPFPDLCGVGVAYKLAQALLHGHRRTSYLAQMLDLVALGTVTDLVALRDENRYLVRLGLQALNSTTGPGLRELICVSNLQPGKLDADNISWALGPRLNAASRMDSANTSYQLLMTESEEEARRLAVELDTRNAERKRAADEAYETACHKLAGKFDLPLLFDADESYPAGVMGLVASKLAEQHYRPAIIAHRADGVCKGSGRSIPEFNLVDALLQCQDMLVAFGGHPQAAGFTVETDHLPVLEERLIQVAEQELSGLDLRPRLTIDAEVPPSALAGETFRLMQKMEPFGQGNPPPTFLSRGIEVLECRNSGETKRLNLKFRDQGVVWQAIDFESRVAMCDIASPVDIVYTVRTTLWNGEEVLQFKILDAVPSSATSAPSTPE